MHIDIIELYRHGQLLARYEVLDRGIEIGRAQGCDIVVDDPGLADRHWLLLRKRGTVVLVDVSLGKRQQAIEHHLPLNRSIPLGRAYSVVRVDVERPASTGKADDTNTSQLDHLRVAISHWVILVGRGPEARRVPVRDAPIHVGRADDNDIVLCDASVSQSHARLEPCEAGLLLRDLGSTNGTFVNGLRVHTALLNEGAVIRVGRTDLRVAQRNSPSSGPGPTMIAESCGMLQVLSEVRRMAPLPWPVLVVGESGTGKEGVALSLHEHSARKAQRFVAINAGGLPRELVESELFGHEEGAFTGAAGMHKGVFEQAHGGTLFLDEIGELPLDLQARLLRVLETGEVRRVGGEGPVRTDVRLVCATHRDLRSMVGAGAFRQDLYYRLARLLVEVPALRSRPEDVRALSEYFLRDIARELGQRELSPDALARLQAYDWPGNVRELRNVLCAAAASCGTYIEVNDVEQALCRLGGSLAAREISADAMQRVIAQHRGNMSAAARALGMPRSTLRDRMRAA